MDGSGDYLPDVVVGLAWRGRCPAAPTSPTPVARWWIRLAASGQHLQDGPPSPARTAEAVQRATGVIAARHRGDLDGAEALLTAFTGPTEQTRAFCLLAELALGLVRSQTGQTVDELVQELNILVEQVLPAPPS
ncbi:hypothetical protein [Dactylosporangium sp. NPDC048998]|uniref:hypothetical protein n=1 Tax=Dactylosporangium sp. NPDC048998 TaxID=3363976 RepID=UPI003711C570